MTTYLDDKRKKQLLLSLDEQRHLIKKRCNDGDSKRLLLWECQVVYYEIQILSGVVVLDLYEQIKSDSEKEALAKACSNISDCNFRIESGYFDPISDALMYDDQNLNSNVKQKILEMKLKK